MAQKCPNLRFSTHFRGGNESRSICAYVACMPPKSHFPPSECWEDIVPNTETARTAAPHPLAIDTIPIFATFWNHYCPVKVD